MYTQAGSHRETHTIRQDVEPGSAIVIVHRTWTATQHSHLLMLHMQQSMTSQHTVPCSSSHLSTVLKISNQSVTTKSQHKHAATAAATFRLHHCLPCSRQQRIATRPDALVRYNTADDTANTAGHRHFCHSHSSCTQLSPQVLPSKHILSSGWLDSNHCRPSPAAQQHTQAPTRSRPGILPPFCTAAADALPPAGADHFAVTVLGCVKNCTPALPYMCRSPTKLPLQPVKLNMGRGTGMGTLMPTMPTCSSKVMTQLLH